MKSPVCVIVVVCSLALQACSSRPRDFTPTLAVAPASQAQFDTAYAECQQLFVSGKLNASGRRASVAGGAAAGAGTAAVGGALAAGGGYAGLAAASATIVLLPFAILGGAWGMSKVKRAKRERAVKLAMEGCLHDRGFDVAGWSRALKKPVVGPRPNLAQ